MEPKVHALTKILAPPKQSREISIAIVSTLATLLLSSSLALAQSKCFGTPENGRLENGVSLPATGKNFEVYYWLGHFIGRAYVHEDVHKVTVKAFEDLAEFNAELKFVYGETGWKNGGSFKPHKTHRNGTSVDFMVPVRNEYGKSVPLPCSLFNKFCYNIEFDSSGKYNGYKIDFDAIHAHLERLLARTKQAGIGIRRIIFDPDLTKHLKESEAWTKTPLTVEFSPHKPWVRHDEHYHIDFDVPCEP